MQAQHQAIHTEELAKLAELTMEALLPLLVVAMQSPSATPPQLAALPAACTATSSGRGGCGAPRPLGAEGLSAAPLASAAGLMGAVLRPVLKLACRCAQLRHALWATGVGAHAGGPKGGAV